MIKLDKTMISVFYLLLLIVIIVALDVLIFRYDFWARLIVNIGIVLVFIAFYLRFINNL